MKLTTWVRTHPWPFAARMAWVLLNVVLAGIGGGILAYGPFQASRATALFFGMVCGLLAGGLWLHQQITAVTGDKSVAQRWQRWLTLPVVGLLLLVGALSLIQVYRSGAFAHARQDRVQNFNQLWRAMAAHYPYFQEKNIDWQAVHKRYLPDVQAAQSNDQYHAVVSQMLAELGDAHTGVVQPRLNSGRHYFGTGLLLDDGIVVDQIAALAREAGMVSGAQILAIDGLPVEQSLEAIPVTLRNSATPWHARYLAAFHLLSTAGDSLEVTFSNPGEPARTVVLQRPLETPTPPATQPDTGPLITGERLPSGWGLVRIPTFSSRNGHDLIAEFDVALDSLMDSPGLILDLRGNGGGNTRFADAIAARFFDYPFCYGQDRFRQRLPQRAWRLTWEYCLQPRRPTYQAPVALLIDSANMSTAEQFIVAMTYHARATTIGRPTGGSSGNPITFTLSGGGLARFSTGAFISHAGAIIEGNGVQPAQRVAYTMQDYCTQHDPDLPAAEQALSAAVTGPDLPAISSFLEGQVKRQRLPGLAIAITQGDQIIYQQGFGISRPAEPITPQTPFYIGSLTKSFTALAVVQLVEAGLVELDTPVQQYLPWFEVADDEATRQITIRHLLNQTSGLSNRGFSAPLLPTNAAIEEIVRQLSSARPSAPAGERYQYFNQNYSVLGLIIETVTSQAYSDYLAEHILAPLAMRTTFTEPNTAQAAGLAQGHLAFLGIPVVRPEPFLTYDLPAGFIISTAEDMAHYLIAHNNAGQFGEAQILSASGMEILHTPVSAIGSPYAMGWVVSDRNGVHMVHHNGAVQTFTSVARLLPEQGYGLIILSNQSSLLQILAINNQIADGLTDLILGKSPQPGITADLIYAGIILLYTLTIVLSGIRILKLAQAPLPDNLPKGRLSKGLVIDLLTPWLLLIAILAFIYFTQGASGLHRIFQSIGNLPDIAGWVMLVFLLGLIESFVKIYKTFTGRQQEHRT